MANETKPQPAAQSVRQNPAPPSEVEQLKAQLAALTARVEEMTNPQLSARPAQPTINATVLPASELNRAREATKRQQKDEAMRRLREKQEADLLAGPARFEVSLKSNPKRIVGARDAIEARDKYLRYFGVKSTTHEVIARDVSAAA